MIYIKTYDEPKFNIKEIQRYAGCGDECTDEIKSCIDEVSGKLSYRVCYTELSADCDIVSDWIKKSTALSKNLEGCGKIILFAAGVGLEIDRLIAKYSKISPSKALFFQAVGTERVESLCNAFNNEIKFNMAEDGMFVRPRFSPGYGDFPIDAQKDIFSILDCPRRIGVTLNDSLIMSPSKSVTAIIGVSRCEKSLMSGCKICNKKDCGFRR